ncbi:hypothetical protein [uncultured Chryseobacterium sp.]|jgi:hypothetical protein|uniref:hypothetical protein n=1 Tax=uncultured Chryseobacterium sp. TaxID=259322 RepID=UPI002630A7FE|nr:hypothetical protein [uncultured Chryseobacterium sp.]
MRKLIICLAVATVAVSCKKVPDGGNKGTLKLEEGVERYSDDEQTSGDQDKLSEYRGDMHNAGSSMSDSAATKHTEEVKPAESAKAEEAATPKAEH